MCQGCEFCEVLRGLWRAASKIFSRLPPHRVVACVVPSPQYRGAVAHLYPTEYGKEEGIL